MSFMSELKPTQLDEKKDVKLKAPEPANVEVVGGEDSEPTQVALQPQQPLSPGVETPARQEIDFAPNYEVIEVLGQGGMGTVYKVFDKALKTVFAIKVLRPEFSQDAFTIKRFQQEAKAVSKLTHPNLATVYDQGVTTGGAPYLVMGYIAGKGLDKILKEEHRLDSTRAIEMFLQIADSVQYAHEHGVVHRDLKPSNIIISNDGQAHIVDFGIAKILPVNQARETQNLTGTGEVFGSPSYMSPEQGMGYNLEARSDIYSFGCVMYEILTGRVPFEAPNPIQTIVQHLSEKPPAMQTQIYGKNSVPKALEQVVMKCLEKDPGDRYQSMRELHADLERIQSGKKITARVAKEDPLLTRSMLLRISLGVIINILVLTLTIGQYDGNIKEKIRAQSLISSANALSKLVYDAGVALGGYSLTKSPLFNERYLKIKQVIPEEIDSLRSLCPPGAGEGGRESQTLKNIELEAQTSIRILDDARTAIDSGTSDQAQFKARHMYKQIRVLADDLQIQLKNLTAGAVKVSTEPGFASRVKLTLIGELLLLFIADVLFTIRIMREVQRTAKRRVWKIKQGK
jgi:serine/threonine protein kinase